MLLAISLFGIFMSVVLLYFNARKVTPWVYLIFLFLMESINGLTLYILLFSKSATLVSIFFVNIGPLFFIGGPALYWYVRSMLTGDAHLTQKDIWHLVPMIVNFALVTPYLNTPYIYKVVLAQALINNTDLMLTFEPTLLPNQVIFLARPIHFLGYAIFSFTRLIRHRQLKQNLQTASIPRFMVKWLYVVVAFPSIFMIGHALVMANAFQQQTFTQFLAMDSFVVFMLGFTGVVISPFFFPRVLYGISDIPHISTVHQIHVKATEDAESKKSTLDLEDDYLYDIGLKADAYMQTFQPFLSPDLNLIQFSVMLKIPTHHLSHYFREVRMQSFIDYRNTWRVQYAKELITAGLASGITLEAIGVQSGFSARSSFIVAFKKSEGISPSTFAAAHGA